MELENQLKEIIITGLKLKDYKAGDIDDDSPIFGGGLGLDSLDAVELIVLLKKHLNVEIKEIEIAKKAFASVKALAGFVREYNAKK